jgi:hypothetical protein
MTLAVNDRVNGARKRSLLLVYSPPVQRLLLCIKYNKYEDLHYELGGMWEEGVVGFLMYHCLKQSFSTDPLLCLWWPKNCN